MPLRYSNSVYESGGSKDLVVRDEFMRYQLVGEVMAHQG